MCRVTSSGRPYYTSARLRSTGVRERPVEHWQHVIRRAGYRPSMVEGESALSTVDLYWIPLGAGATVVRLSGRVYEVIKGLLAHRRPMDLYHSALVVTLGDDRFTIESAPIPNLRSSERGVVAEGAVCIRWLGRYRVFRYEIRLWRGGSIPDLGYAVASPVRVATDEAVAKRIIELAPHVPMPVWGRDELGTGDMWNSNSLTAWLLARAGVDADALQPPTGGRAPGWDAGVSVAQRPIEPET